MSMTSPCYGAPVAFEHDLDKLMALPVEMKAVYSKMIIQRFYIEQKGKVYVSFSGGKDSTVLLDLARSMYPDVPAVFADTGLEFPEIRVFVKATEKVEMVRPEMSFRQVVMTKGYPVVSKEVAHTIDQAQRGCPGALKMISIDRDESKFSKKHYAWLMDAPFRISSECCTVLKKKPMEEYAKRTGRAPIIGTKGTDSRLRMTNLRQYGEIVKDKCMPLGIWTDEDIWSYIHAHNLPYSPIYDKGYRATGCIFCAFGIMQDKGRFLKLKATHPSLWAYCMKPVDKGGLGMKEVCDFLGVPSGCEQSNLAAFADMGGSS